jgi:hypothetical protein
MLSKLSEIEKQYSYVNNITVLPAPLLVYAADKGILDWTKIDAEVKIDKSDYIKWRDKILMYVLEPLKIKDFDWLLPPSFKQLYEYLETVDLTVLLEVMENIRDIAYDNPIGNIRREGWHYIRYDSSVGLSEKDWIVKQMIDVLRIENNTFLYSDIILYMYWHKRLKLLR